VRDPAFLVPIMKAITVAIVTAKSACFQLISRPDGSFWLEPGLLEEDRGAAAISYHVAPYSSLRLGIR
jgi:hypothetical protein